MSSFGHLLGKDGPNREHLPGRGVGDAGREGIGHVLQEP
jgi:hypothetical protein